MAAVCIVCFIPFHNVVVDVDDQEQMVGFRGSCTDAGPDGIRRQRVSIQGRLVQLYGDCLSARFSRSQAGDGYGAIANQHVVCITSHVIRRPEHVRRKRPGAGGPDVLDDDCDGRFSTEHMVAVGVE